jgi:hypothetical protein
MPTAQQAYELIAQLVSRPTTQVNGMKEAESIAQCLQVFRELVTPKEPAPPEPAAPAST